MAATDISSKVQERAVAGVPPMTPDQIVTSTDLSEQSKKAIIGLTAQEKEALAELFPEMPSPEDTPISIFPSPISTISPPSTESSQKSAPSEIITFLEMKWAKYAREFEQEIFAFPHPVRRDFCKGVLYEILNASIERNTPIYGLTILNVRIDRNLVDRDTKGLDLVFTYQTPRGPTSVGIEINNSEHGSTVFQSLRRLRKLVKGNIRYAFILRDEELSLQRTATKSLDLAESLTEYGGLYYIDFHSNQALLATKKLMDFASAGDLTIGSHTVTRNQAMTYVFEECLSRITIFQTLFSHLSSVESTPRASGTPVSESSDAVEAIITILKFNPNMTLDRLCLLLNRNEGEIVPVLKMLAIRGMISYDGKNIHLL
jgi:hypothetical protein